MQEIRSVFQLIGKQPKYLGFLSEEMATDLLTPLYVEENLLTELSNYGIVLNVPPGKYNRSGLVDFFEQEVLKHPLNVYPGRFDFDQIIFDVDLSVLEAKPSSSEEWRHIFYLETKDFCEFNEYLISIDFAKSIDIDNSQVLGEIENELLNAWVLSKEDFWLKKGVVSYDDEKIIEAKCEILEKKSACVFVYTLKKEYE